jgi:hypothetical protein
MASSGTLRRVGLVRTVVSEERSASIIRGTRVSELGTMLAIISNRHTLRRNVRLLLDTANVPSSPILLSLMLEALLSSETSDLTVTTRTNIPEDSIRHAHAVLLP